MRADPELEPEIDEPLEGGNVGRVWRVGQTVRRECGPWSPAVHRLLRHLEGMPAVPRFHGIDDLGREVLDYLPGRIVDVNRGVLTDAQLAGVGAWTRSLHRATADFTDDGPWRFPPPPGADVVGHNDIAPYNVCFDGDTLVGVFDWDLAGPTTVLFELGFVAWNCVPLHRPPDVDDADAWSAARLRILADAYGGVGPGEVLAATLARTEHTITGMLAAASAGDLGIRRLMAATGEPEPTSRALDALRGRVPAIQRLLSSRT
jgi:aminoglycoside phosphotransferase (APT) family kinase protein